MTIEDAIAFVATLHKGHKDKAGLPYIWHPLRIAMSLRTEEQQIVALLHDVLEDTGLGRHVLRRIGIPKRIVDAVDALTRRNGESYERFLRRAAQNHLAREVKRADLEDNIRRLPDLPVAKAIALFNKYARPLRELRESDGSRRGSRSRAYRLRRA